MDLYKLLSGLLLLALGRRLFWLLVALMGFLVGMELAGEFLSGRPSWLVLAAAIGTGLLGAILAVFAHRLAFALAGFLAGSYLALIAAQSFGVSGASELLFIIGGIAGALISAWFLDWAIIVLSSLVGGAAIVDALGLGQMPGFLAFAALVTAGILFQAKFMGKGMKK
jgi:hypothetical protein